MFSSAFKISSSLKTSISPDLLEKRYSNSLIHPHFKHLMLNAGSSFFASKSPIAISFKIGITNRFITSPLRRFSLHIISNLHTKIIADNSKLLSFFLQIMTNFIGSISLLRNTRVNLDRLKKTELIEGQSNIFILKLCFTFLSKDGLQEVNSLSFYRAFFVIRW